MIKLLAEEPVSLKLCFGDNQTKGVMFSELECFNELYIYIYTHTTSFLHQTQGATRNRIYIYVCIVNRECSNRNGEDECMCNAHEIARTNEN